MQFFEKILLAFAAGSVLGLSATYVTLERGWGFGAVRSGPWIAWPKTGLPDIDPYSKAAIARTGETPLGTAEGVRFIASSDGDGQKLTARCDYKISGTVQPARYWTVTVMDTEGFVIANPLDRYGFTSSELLRDELGNFEISIATEARPGNWLPLGRDGTFFLMLSLYDTTISSLAAHSDAALAPLIQRGACRP